MMDFLRENDARYLDDDYAVCLEQLEQYAGVSHVE